jgi:hypothetical protein
MGVVLAALADGAADRAEVLAHAQARAPHWLAAGAGVVAIERGELVWSLD